MKNRINIFIGILLLFSNSYAQFCSEFYYGEKQIFESLFNKHTNSIRRSGGGEPYLESFIHFYKKLNNENQKKIDVVFFANYSIYKKRIPELSGLAPKRAVDFIISKLKNPYDLFRQRPTAEAYIKYLESIKSEQAFNNFLPPEIVLDSIYSLQKDLLNHSHATSIIAFGSFFNGRATEKSDVDYYVNFIDGNKSLFNPIELNKNLQRQSLSEMDTEAHFSIEEFRDDKLRFGLRVHDLAIEITKEQIYFFIRNPTTQLIERFYL